MQTRDEVEGLHNYVIFLSYFINKLVYVPVVVTVIPSNYVVSRQFSEASTAVVFIAS